MTMTVRNRGLVVVVVTPFPHPPADIKSFLIRNKVIRGSGLLAIFKGFENNIASGMCCRELVYISIANNHTSGRVFISHFFGFSDLSSSSLVSSSIDTISNV
jgi:hypothetical protein